MELLKEILQTFHCYSIHKDDNRVSERDAKTKHLVHIKSLQMMLGFHWWQTTVVNTFIA